MATRLLSLATVTDELDEMQTVLATDDITDIPRNVAKVLAKRIYINEDLTQKRDYLLFKARQAKKMKRILDAWSFNGNIRMKKLNGEIVSVNEESSIPDS